MGAHFILYFYFIILLLFVCDMYVYLTVSVCGAVINMPLFELHACV